MRNLHSHIISSLNSQSFRGESLGCMFIEGRPFESSYSSGDN